MNPPDIEETTPNKKWSPLRIFFFAMAVAVVIIGLILLIIFVTTLSKEVTSDNTVTEGDTTTITTETKKIINPNWALFGSGVFLVISGAVLSNKIYL